MGNSIFHLNRGMETASLEKGLKEQLDNNFETERNIVEQGNEYAETSETAGKAQKEYIKIDGESEQAAEDWHAQNMETAKRQIEVTTEQSDDLKKNTIEAVDDAGQAADIERQNQITAGKVEGDYSSSAKEMEKRSSDKEQSYEGIRDTGEKQAEDIENNKNDINERIRKPHQS